MTDKPRLIKCVRAKLCSQECGFKKGVVFEHLMQTYANVPQADTVEAYEYNPDGLRNFFETGWWIGCFYHFAEADDPRYGTNGYLFWADSKHFDEGVRSVQH